MAMARSWDGLGLVARKNRAAARAVVGIGMAVAVDTKRITHRVSGTLARSVHAAPVSGDHDTDERLSEVQDLMLSKGFPVPTVVPGEAVVEVGSWLPYACVEWVGRGHPGITQGLEGVRGSRADSIVWVAFKEEGL